jgi:hypothetical protein
MKPCTPTKTLHTAERTEKAGLIFKKEQAGRSNCAGKVGGVKIVKILLAAVNSRS